MRLTEQDLRIHIKAVLARRKNLLLSNERALDLSSFLFEAVFILLKMRITTFRIMAEELNMFKKINKREIRNAYLVKHAQELREALDNSDNSETVASIYEQQSKQEDERETRIVFLLLQDSLALFEVS